MLPSEFRCRHEESNPGPDDYKSTALPTELRRHIISRLIFGLPLEQCALRRPTVDLL